MADGSKLIDRRSVLAGGAAVLACLGGLFFGLHRRRSADPLAVRQQAESLGAEHGILIGYGSPDTFFVPPFTAEDARVVGGTSTLVDIAAMPAALAGIEQSLRVYPPGFFARLCKAIFLCGSLTLDGSEAGGTYGRAWIVLVATKKVGDAGIFETARLGVHHEFSSLVWNRIPALPARWAGLLPAGWTPVQNNAQALKAQDHGPIKTENGFLSPYGATTEENDFNVYAETIFTDARRIAGLANDYPVVARKTALLMAAYTHFDDRLSGVFERLGLQRFRSALLAPLQEDISISPNAIPSGQLSKPGRITKP